MDGYTVREWVATPAGNPCVTVVDRRGRSLHVTIPRRLSTAQNVRHVVEFALANRPAEHPDNVARRHSSSELS